MNTYRQVWMDGKGGFVRGLAAKVKVLTTDQMTRVQSLGPDVDGEKQLYKLSSDLCISARTHKCNHKFAHVCASTHIHHTQINIILKNNLERL